MKSKGSMQGVRDGRGRAPHNRRGGSVKEAGKKDRVCGMKVTEREREFLERLNIEDQKKIAFMVGRMVRAERRVFQRTKPSA